MVVVRRVLVGILAVVLPLGLVAFPVAAQGEREVTEKVAPVMFVLDASNSMNDPDPSGATKLDAAKKALHTVVDGLPGDAEVGLSVYGHSKDSDDPDSCSDVETLFPVGELDASAVKSAVDGIQARGMTPIGESLRHAVQALPDSGPRSVVLVSDGADTCAPPPACEVAAELAESGVDLVLHTVGFDVDAETQEELRCIADAGDGRYIDAPDAAALEEELPVITEVARRTYQAHGIPVEGTPKRGDAPEIAPGQYVDRFGSGETRYYALDVPDEMTVHVAASQIRPAEEGIGGPAATFLDVKLVNGEGKGCGGGREVDSDMNWEAHNTVAFSMVNSPDDRCYSEDGRYYLRVERGTSERSLGDRDVELLVVFEPPVDADHGQSPDGLVDFGEVRGESQPVVGGSSFNEATTLEGSGNYTDQIRWGEAVFYRVPLDWGQGLAYQVRIEDADTNKGSANFKTELYSPVRQNEFFNGTDDTVYTTDAKTLDPIETPYVYHGNRDVGGYIETVSLAGDYYIVVQLNVARGNSKAKESMDLELSVLVDGEPVDPPEYRAIGEYPAEPYFGPSRQASEEDADSEGPAVVATGATKSITPWWWIGSGIVVVIVLASIGLIWTVRHRNTAR